MWHCPQPQLPVTSAEGQKATGGLCRQDLPMRRQPISSAAPNAETPGEALTEMLFTIMGWTYECRQNNIKFI